MDKKALWNLIITLRYEYLKTNSDLDCEDTTFIPKKDISENIEKLSQIAGVINCQEINSNFSKSDLSDFAEMFITLNSCPSFLEKLYCKAFYDSKSTEAITLLTSNIVKQSKPNVKLRAQRVFAKITQVFGFKHIKFQHEVNQSFGKNVKLMKNIIHIKGEKDVEPHRRNSNQPQSEVKALQVCMSVTKTRLNILGSICMK